MTHKTSLQQVIEILQELKYTDDQIAQFCAELSQQGYKQLYSEALVSFTNEDLEKIEKCETQEDTQKEIAHLYQLRTGKDPVKDMEEYINVFSKAFLEEFHKQKPA